MWLRTKDEANDSSHQPPANPPQNRRFRIGLLSIFSLTLVLAGVLFLHPIAQAQDLPVVITKVANVEEAQVDDQISYTIEVSNTGRTDTDALVVTDVLPDGVAFVDGSLEFDRGEAAYDEATRTVRWGGVLKGGDKVRLTFAVTVLPVIEVAKCEAAIVNQATVALAQPTGTALGVAPAVVQVKRICPDLGDAPDSTNHAAAAMTAYPGPVMARYPTVFDPATGAPQGPRHRFPRADAWLGNRVSGERDADLLPDEDLATNLHPAADIADRDNFDDGIAKWPTLQHCTQTDMAVNVTVVGGVKTRYVNAWIDWNRDGDWEDSFECPGAVVSEWVVQNFATNLNNGAHAVGLPPFLAMTSANLPDNTRWLRVSIADQPAPTNPATQRADGRGPQFGYRFGETEDYPAKLEPPAMPHLELTKQANLSVVNPGGQIEYSITIVNSGNAPANGFVMHDPIPTGTSYVAGSVNATIPTATYNAGLNRIEWTGNIPAGGSVTIKFKVNVSREIACDAVIRNRAELLAPTGAPVMDATAFVKVNCPGQPILDIKKQANVPFVIPGGEIEYTVTIVNGGTGPATGVTMVDPIPAGATYVAGSVNATAPTPSYNAGLNRIEWTGNIPVGGSVTVKFKVKVSEQIDCGAVIHNRAGLLGANGEPSVVADVRTPVECPQPNLIMKKRADVATVLPGGQIEYTIVVSNTGTGPANGISVVDPIPAGTTFVAGSESSTLPAVAYDGANNWIKWTGNLPAGASVTIKFKVQVEQGRCDYGIPNVAKLFDAQGNTITGAEAKVWVGCPDQPIIRIDKKANPTVVGPGGTIEYTVVIANVGSAAATGVTMIDPIPSGTTFVAGSETATAPAVAYDGGNNWIKWNGNIPAGGNVVVTFKVTVGEQISCDTIIHNRAGIVGDTATGAQLVAEADVKVECGRPELTIKKRADITQTTPGGVIQYTIVIANSGAGAANGVTMLDPIPAGTSYLPGSASATAPTVDDSNPAQIKWTGNIPAGGTVTITFKVVVSMDIACQETIWNRAVLFGAGLQLGTEAVPVKITCATTDRFPDFGDAPDSQSNHSGRTNTAYTTGPVAGRFPTVWDNTPAAEGSGPHHAQANQYWLGDRVTREKDADLLPDDDGVTNILNNGTADVADQDKADDGWLNPDAPMLDCREAVLKVRISRALIPPPVQRLYLNVWFDGNRDGDWEDLGACPQINGRSFEWIVQNWWIDPTTIPPAGFVDVAVGTVLVHNAQPTADAWLRFSLSEQKAILNPSTNLGDGRGVAFPNAFRLGETEDYYRKGITQGEPGKIRIEKKADPAGPVNVGDAVNYSILVTHVGGTAPAFTTMQDLLPTGVALVSGPTVTELTPSAAPLVAGFNPGTGPSGAVTWSGMLSPNAVVRIDFSVRVRTCVDLLRNVATAKNTDGTTVQAVTETDVNCQPTEPGISLTKRVVVQNTSEATEADILASDTAIYYLTLAATDGLTHTVHISDAIPSGLVAVAVSSSSGVANIINSGHTVIWDGVVGPANAPITIKILVRPEEKFACDQRLVNIALWTAEGHSGQSNAVTLRSACRDLGDAPDSTNHAGTKMNAYTGVQANFPTVFNVAAPERGPRHDRPRPIHLGKGVSAEVEADLNFDSDGLNNILPATDQADKDRADDGLLLSTVTLNHCQTGTMQVLVSIDTTVAAALPNGTGYLNIWVDSNRDGDWADRFDCPQTATGAASTALEHIVIDQPINAAALGAGLHTISVNTTGLVAWPTDLVGKAAWLRITLSERLSNKPFTTYGDGRGYDDPFRLGETEDYLLPGRDTGQGGNTADPVVTKRGEIWPDYNPETGARRWVVGWIVNYANLGSSLATNVHVVDTYDAPQSLLAEHSIPLVPHTQSGNTLDYNVGNLPVGGSGLVIIRTELPFNTAPGTVIRNTAVVNSSNDGNTINNTSVATVTVPILPPMITDPIAGTTCTQTVTVAGHAQPNVTVDLYVDSALAATMPADANGDWSTTLTLAAGSHNLHAIARLGSQSSDPSPTVTIIVDPTLFWNPISLRFQDDAGHLIIPSGRLDESGWSVFLRPGHTYTVSLQLCCTDPNAQVTIEIGDISLTLTDPDGDRTFTATFTVPEAGRFTGTVRICVTCNLIRRCSDGQVTIDPEGTVFNLITGLPIDGATVACLQADLNGASGQQTFNLWPAADFGQINPQAVAADGYFSFFTPQGTYRLNVNKAGYQPYESMDLTVVDAPVHFDVPLTPLVTDATDEQISITENGFEPAVLTVEPGTVIEWINAGTGVHSSTSITPSVSFEGTTAAGATDDGGWDSGFLTTGESYKRQLTVEGAYLYRDSANPDATATIIVKQTTPVTTANKVYLPAIFR
uniref:VgrG protein n=1 Tax=uncultured bacterium A1Q1_fos_485 TaxID=1256576 RepID=L7VYN4_9BACT|nr:VgrG protein [uncultured bacterium A1Q1_fos_485]